MNLAIVPVFGGWTAFRLFRRLLPADGRGVVGATGLAAGLSVVLAAVAFSLEWLFGATAPIPFDTVFGAMVGVHLLIGVAEGVISGLVVASVLAARPDVVTGAADLPIDRLTGPAIDATGPGRLGRRPFVIAAILASLLVATVVSQFAADSPDGLERVAEDQGFAEAADEHPLADTLLADYAIRDIDDPALSLAVAGVTGVVVSLAVANGLLAAMRSPTGSGRRRDHTVTRP